MIWVFKKSIVFKLKLFFPFCLVFGFQYLVFGDFFFIFCYVSVFSEYMASLVSLFWPPNPPSQSCCTSLPSFSSFFKNAGGLFLHCHVKHPSMPFLPAVGHYLVWNSFSALQSSPSSPSSLSLSIIYLSLHLGILFFFGFDRLRQGETESWNERWIRRRDGFGSKARLLTQIFKAPWSSTSSSSRGGNFRVQSLSHGPSQGWRRGFAKGAERGGAWAGRFLGAWGWAHEVAGPWRGRLGEGGPQSAAVAAAEQPHGRRRHCCHGAGHDREKSRVVEEERWAEWGGDGGDSGTPRATQKHVTCFLKAGDRQLSSTGRQCWRTKERGSEERCEKKRWRRKRNEGVNEKEKEGRTAKPVSVDASVNVEKQEHDQITKFILKRKRTAK